MTDSKDDRRRHDDRHRKPKKEKREHKHDSAFHEALSALKHMPAMNPGGIAPIPDEVKGTTDTGTSSDD